MTGEAPSCAAEICVSIAREVHILRATGSKQANANISMLVDQLGRAPARDAVDALAFAALARKLLLSVVEKYDFAEMSTFDQDQQSCSFALAFIQRAVETLEAETGLGAEGFTGEAGTIN